MHVRPATDSDIPAIVRVTNLAYAVETFIDGTRTDESDVARHMSSGRFLLAEDEQGIAASVYVEINSGRGYFGMLSVDPVRQGTGLGRVMIEAAERFAREHGCTHMDITVLSLRTELPPFYRKFGYREIGTEPFLLEAGRQLSEPCHCILMEKPL